jgi:hypothetical protein
LSALQDTDILPEMVIEDKIKTLERIDINKIVGDAIREIEDFIIELNREQLYEKGEINVNQPTKREYYAQSTIRQKQKQATFKKTEFVTLRWEGDFYDSFKVIVFDEEFIISATDLKWANWLEGNKRFGNALGLTEASKEKLKEEIKPIIIRRIKDEL